ncbi:MAG: diguanylate cyclase [Acidobacteria bacterium]|nr:diguanylate cyclase [Acidobacteriota bacterium]
MNRNDIQILIVDDEPDFLQAIADAFKQAKPGYRMLRAPNGAIALEIAHKKAPDLVITDWDMPVMNGLELIRALQAQESTRDIPVIMFTGVMTTSENLQMALEAGAKDYIRKPLDRVELLARTNAMLHLADYISQVKAQNQALRESYAQMEKMARTDPLTQLSNRRDFRDHLAHELAACQRNGRKMVLAIADIDHFKHFNDQFGHECGDSVLVALAEQLRGLIRNQDYVGRWGGEEFILLFPETDLEGGRIIAEKICQAVHAQPHQFQAQAMPISLTIGLSAYRDNDDANALLKRADEALYRGKNAGRNQVVTA